MLLLKLGDRIKLCGWVFFPWRPVHYPRSATYDCQGIIVRGVICGDLSYWLISCTGCQFHKGFRIKTICVLAAPYSEWLSVSQRIQNKKQTPSATSVSMNPPLLISVTLSTFTDRHAPSSALYVRCLPSQNPTIQTFYCWLSLHLRLWSLYLGQTPSVSPSNTHPTEHVQIGP